MGGPCIYLDIIIKIGKIVLVLTPLFLLKLHDTHEVASSFSSFSVL